jgi:hypothetical protein
MENPVTTEMVMMATIINYRSSYCMQCTVKLVTMITYQPRTEGRKEGRKARRKEGRRGVGRREGKGKEGWKGGWEEGRLMGMREGG